MVKNKTTDQSEISAVDKNNQQIKEEKKPENFGAGSTSRKIVRGQAYVKASYNNTMISITDINGNMIAWSSAGSLGFKGAKKATPYAATKIAETVIEKIKKIGISDVAVFVKGIGGGREAAIRALANKGLNINSIKDVTPLPHNGCKPPKVRRI